MARLHPKKCRLFGVGRSRSTSNLSPRSSQAPAGDAIPPTETSARGTLARIRRFLRKSNSTPSPVAAEAVGTGAGEGTQEQPGQPLAVQLEDKPATKKELKPVPAVGEDIDHAAQAFDNIAPMSHLSEGTANIINDANTAFTDIQNFTNTYLEPFKVFNEVVKTLSNVHTFFHSSNTMIECMS
ncbi:hypothetical protein M404DRAFT_895501 [Pisolithus tinctorius Marx 270]|uniref:Uncharacterized protein n=1 Tax=Pisolithus tinctorius Marx 270 TaxID=870435 RepID=A0A0C3NQ79_PISTI|nr:hypothetical protein M404DRAFT_895501 [Pisolithus tinctorius Marx 270]